MKQGRKIYRNKREEDKQKAFERRTKRPPTGLSVGELEKRLRKASSVLHEARLILRERLPESAATSQVENLLEEWR